MAIIRYCAIARTGDEKGFRIKASFCNRNSCSNNVSHSFTISGSKCSKKESIVELYKEMFFDELSKQLLSANHPKTRDYQISKKFDANLSVAQKIDNNLSFYAKKVKGWAYIIILTNKGSSTAAVSLTDEQVACTCLDELSRTCCKNFNYYLTTTPKMMVDKKNMKNIKKETRKMKRDNFCRFIALKYSSLLNNTEGASQLLSPATTLKNAENKMSYENKSTIFTNTGNNIVDIDDVSDTETDKTLLWSNKNRNKYLKEKKENGIEDIYEGGVTENATSTTTEGQSLVNEATQVLQPRSETQCGDNLQPTPPALQQQIDVDYHQDNISIDQIVNPPLVESTKHQQEEKFKHKKYDHNCNNFASIKACDSDNGEMKNKAHYYLLNQNKTSDTDTSTDSSSGIGDKSWPSDEENSCHDEMYILLSEEEEESEADNENYETFATSSEEEGDEDDNCGEGENDERTGRQEEQQRDEGENMRKKTAFLDITQHLTSVELGLA